MTILDLILFTAAWAIGTGLAIMTIEYHRLRTALTNAQAALARFRDA